MALPRSATSNGPLLRHNTKLHSSRTVAQVFQFYFFMFFMLDNFNELPSNAAKN